jgi:hypothetical protein
MSTEAHHIRRLSGAAKFGGATYLPGCREKESGDGDHRHVDDQRPELVPERGAGSSFASGQIELGHSWTSFQPLSRPGYTTVFISRLGSGYLPYLLETRWFAQAPL